jgi:hypothetical protein
MEQNVTPAPKQANGAQSPAAGQASSPKYSFDEFKLYYESTEKVTDRRQNGNKLNYSICVAVLFAIAAIWNWSLDHQSYSSAGFTLSSVLSLLAALFSWFWIGQIRDFKSLNTAKFTVLNDVIAPNVAIIPGQLGVTLVSSNPFQREWELLEAAGRLQTKPRYEIRALESSNVEYFVPQAFIVIFVIVLLVSVLPIVIHVSAYLDGWRAILRL